MPSQNLTSKPVNKTNIPPPPLTYNATPEMYTLCLLQVAGSQRTLV